MNLLLADKGIPNQEHIIQFLLAHVYRRNLMIIVGCIVIDSFVRVAAGSVDRRFILLICNLTASSGLINGSQNVEELTDAFPFGSFGDRIHFYKSRSDKAGLGG